MQLLAPGSVNVFVTDPAGQISHIEPPALLYRPAVQLEHGNTGAVENVPAKQAKHELAPTAFRVSVTDPAGHTAHAEVDESV